MASAKDAAGSAMENLVVAQIIQEKLDGGGLPIIVGGTNFYIQVILIYWHAFLYDEVHLIFIDCTI
ncbi:hypothetical protein PVAP13_1NG514138 [Panicum virgatum]|uniref:Uncharacterized protein n=1 Tax=Panicum virgatum TaxID=38727 RepID=A0A8T0WXG1_PANVG|nr:hypothetical protein PVAP13_1NG514138 [Panicum virgatum]